jgi:hypothetical protein
MPFAILVATVTSKWQSGRAVGECMAKEEMGWTDLSPITGPVDLEWLRERPCIVSQSAPGQT